MINLKKIKFSGKLYTFVFFIFAVIIAWIQYSPWMPRVFYGDDLILRLQHIDGVCATKLSQVFTSTCFDKFRPIPFAFNSITMSLFGNAVGHYMVVNIIIQGISATLALLLFYKLSLNNYILAFFFAIAVAGSRFATFPIVVMNGTIEGLAVPMLLGMIYILMSVKKSESDRTVLTLNWMALFLGAMLILTHERYIVVMAWLVIVILTLPGNQALPKKSKNILVLACFLITAVIITYKVLFLGSPFLVGTGGSKIGADYSAVSQHSIEAILSILGFNYGPEYLVGINIKNLPWFPSWLFLFIMVTLFTYGIWKLIVFSIKNKNKIYWPTILLGLAFILLIPPVLTIRMEQRWLFAPFILLLMAIAAVYGLASKISERKIAGFIGAAISISSLSLDHEIMSHYSNTFYVASSRFSEIIFNNINIIKNDKIESIYLLKEKSYCSWVLNNGEFFRLYSDKKINTECIELSSSINNKSKIKIFKDSPSGNLTDVTEEFSNKLEIRNSHSLYNFNEYFLNGKLNNSSQFDTPSKKGVFLLDSDTAIGKNKAIVVLPGLSIKFDELFIPKHAKLGFSLSMIYPTKDKMSARVYVYEGASSKRNLLYSGDVMPPSRGRELSTTPIFISLDKYVGKKIALEFEATTQGDVSGQWLGFFDANIYSN